MSVEGNKWVKPRATIMVHVNEDWERWFPLQLINYTTSSYRLSTKCSLANDMKGKGDHIPIYLTLLYYNIYIYTSQVYDFNSKKKKKR